MMDIERAGAGAAVDVTAIKAVTDNLPDSGALNDLAAILVGIAKEIPRGNTYYVTTVGNDANGGLSWDDSLLTIDAAVNKCAAYSGDKIRVASGTYDENANTGGVLVDVHGITIEGENASEGQMGTSVINSNGAATAVFTVTANDVHIRNIGSTEATATVEGIVSSGFHCVFENIRLEYFMENGIHLAGATWNTIKNCVIYSANDDGIELSGATTYCIIDGVTISSVGGNGIHFNGDGADNNIVTGTHILGAGVTTNGIHINGADHNLIHSSVHIHDCAVGVLLAAGSTDNSVGANITDCTNSYIDNSGNATNDKQASLTHFHAEMLHGPKFTGHQWYVDGTSGLDTNSGTSPNEAFVTIGAAIAAAGVGDKIVVMAKAGKYDENGLNMNLQGLELWCEEGAILEDTTPGTVLTVSAQDCKLVNVVIDNDNNGGIGFDVTTAASISMTGCVALQCTTGFMLDGVKGTFTDCIAVDNTVTGFDVQTKHATFKGCIANGDGQAVRGWYLSNNTADLNAFINCHSSGNTTAGWEIVAGANENTFVNCSTGSTDGAKVDAGTDNTWPGFIMESQIVAGQTVQEDLEDIHDDVHGLGGAAMRGTDGVPTNPMLDTEDGSSFNAIPDMALDSTVAKNATVSKVAGAKGTDAIFDEVDGLAGAAMRGTDGAATSGALTTHATALTNHNTALTNHDTAIDAQLARVQSSRDFWSAPAPVADTTLSTTQATQAITPTIVIPSGTHGIPSGAMIDCVHLLAKWPQIEDTSGAVNAIDNTANAMQIQIDDLGNTGWLTAYEFADDSYEIDGATYSVRAGDMIEGIIDIKARVDGADTYDIQLLNAEVDGDNLIFRDWMWGLRVDWH